MKKLIVVISVIFTLSSCYDVNVNSPKVPEKLLTKKELVDILTDMQLIEAGFSISENRKYERELKPDYYKKVLDKYGISLIQLKENINFYQASPKEIGKVYELVLEKLSKIQSNVLLEIEEEEKLKDSIDNISDSTKNELKPDTLIDVEFKTII